MNGQPLCSSGSCVLSDLLPELLEFLGQDLEHEQLTEVGRERQRCLLRQVSLLRIAQCGLPAQAAEMRRSQPPPPIPPHQQQQQQSTAGLGGFLSDALFTRRSQLTGSGRSRDPQNRMSLPPQAFSNLGFTFDKHEALQDDSVYEKPISQEYEDPILLPGKRSSLAAAAAPNQHQQHQQHQVQAPSMSGALRHRNEDTCRWQRYPACQLMSAGSRLICYKSSRTSGSPSLTFLLAGYTALYVERESSASHVIKLTHPSLPTHALAADSEDEARAWVARINCQQQQHQELLNVPLFGMGGFEQEPDSGFSGPVSSSSTDSYEQQAPPPQQRQPKLTKSATFTPGFVAVARAASTCGGYREGLTAGQSFTLTSPNYPGSYERNQRCIWLFAATNGTGFRVNVTSVKLEGSDNNSTGCRDYLQITDGSSKAAELAYLCQVTSPLQFTANRVYLWVKFQSDHQNQGTGFEITVTTVTDTTSISYSTPVISCNITRYTCPNKECVYLGNLCDSVNDCGCTDYGCDETKCWRFAFLDDVSVVWGLGTGIGLTLSITIFIICGFSEMPERKRPECLRRREHQAGGCCMGRCAGRNRVQQKTPEDAFVKMMRRMTAGKTLKWEGADSDSDASPRSSSRGGESSRRSSFSASSQIGSRRSSAVYAPVYGNTLSPKYSAHPQAPRPAPAPAPTTAATAANSSTQPVQMSPGPVTLTVPSVSSA